MKKAILGMILSGAASYACAQDVVPDQRGWFVGAGVGAVRLSVKPKNEPDLVRGREDTELFTVFGGYNFTNWFGIEFDMSASSDFIDDNTQLDAYVLGTSFAPKFTHHINKNIGVYFKPGLQYLAYEQTVSPYYDNEITWNDIGVFLGAGVQYSFDSGVRARIDYKHSKLTLERSENFRSIFDLYDEKIDLSFNALTFTVNYQF